jgi:predicted ATPase/transcriptional regulator with XRE-family HTH domain
MKEQDYPTHFGEWMKRRRSGLDLTQGELAERGGCSVHALRKIESGERRPSKQLARLLASALEVGEEELETFVRVARGELPFERLRSSAPRAAAEIAAASVRWHGACQRSASCRLPFPPTPLLGREAELAALERLFKDHQCRLLTLTGLGGIGKTRLAVEFARRQCARFPGGVVYAPLTSINSAELIIPAVADALEYAFSGPTDSKEQLFNYLAASTSGRLLMVLDNMEHLLGPPTQTDNEMDAAAVVAEILARLPNVRILTTSRERLNLRGEWTYELHGLPVPAPEFPERLEEYSSAVLFIQSARRTRADFQVASNPNEQSAVIRICQLLEGIPLAIELAAAWVETLSCGEIADEIASNIDFLTTSMRDVPQRHRSLRATFDHSWKLLSEAEKGALCRLSVFQGGFDREAAGKVAVATLPLLASLVSKSLVRRKEDGRYDLHEVIRQYAGSHLSDDPVLSNATLKRHCAHYLNLVADREQDLKSTAQQEAIQELTEEMDNIRAAWAWAVEHKLTSLLDAAVRSLGWMFEVSGLLREGIEQLEHLIRMQPAEAGSEWAKVLGSALTQQGLLYFRTGQFPNAQQRYESAIDMLRSYGDTAVLADALVFLGVIKLLMGEFAQSLSLLEEGLTCARVANDRWFEAYAIYNLGYIDSLMGEYEKGYARMQSGLNVWRALGDPHSISLGLNYLVTTMIRLGRHEEARMAMHESIALCERTGNRWGMGTAYRYLGLATMAAGELTEAQKHFRRSLEIFGEYIEGWDIARTLTYLGQATLLRGDIAEAKALFLEALRLAKGFDSLPLMQDAVAGLAQVEAGSGERERALELAMWVLSRHAVDPEMRAFTQQMRAGVEAGLDPVRVRALKERSADLLLEEITAAFLA